MCQHIFFTVLLPGDCLYLKRPKNVCFFGAFNIELLTFKYHK